MWQKSECIIGEVLILIIKKKTKSILAELFDITNKETSFKVLEARSEHVLSAVFNFIDMINDLPVEQTKKDELQKRLILAIKNKDAKKFVRGLK